MDMGARKHGQGGHLPPPPENVIKCFITVKCSVDQLFQHYFHNLVGVGVAHLVVLACVLRATTKKVVNFF